MNEFELPEFDIDNPIVVPDEDEPLTEEEKLRREIARRLADRALEEEAQTGQRSDTRDLLEQANLDPAAAVPPITTRPQVYISNQPPISDAPVNPDDILGSNPPVTQTTPFTLNEIQSVVPAMMQQKTPNLPPADNAPSLRSVPSTWRDELASLVTGDQRPSGQAYRMLREGLGSAGAGGNPELSLLDITPVGPGIGVNEALANENYPSAALNTLGGVAPVIAKPVAVAIKPVAQQLAELALNAPTAVKTGLAATGLLATATNTVGKSEVEPTVKIETIGGVSNASVSDLTLLGSVVAATAGMAFAPWVFSKMKAGGPRLRAVNDAAPGTMAMSTPIDLARTYDDVNAGALRLMRRSGVNVQAADEVQKTFRLQTRSAANSIANSAIATGRAETPAFTFKTGVSLVDLAKMDSPIVRQYMHARHTVDDLLLAKQKPGKQVGPSVVRGMDINAALGLVNSIERSNPGIKRISQGYRDNLKAMRKFEVSGEYATLTPAEARHLNASRSNYVPIKAEGKPIMGDPIEPPNPFQALADEMQVNMRKRMENEAVGKYIDEVRRVEPSLFVPVTQAELTKNPNWNERVVTMYRRGKKEMYTADRFLANVLKMDPYYITSNTGQLFYSTKRLIEMTTTGELAPHFASTSMLRSWLIAKLTTSQGYKSPSSLGTLAAIPQQLYPQMARSVALSLDRGSAGWLGNLLGSSNMQSMSLKLAKVYDESLFAQLRSVGTHQGSIMQQQTTANNRLTQAIREASPRARGVLQGYRALLGSVHNAHAYNFVRKNYKKGGRTQSLGEVAAEARHLTGDPSVGGQFRTGGTMGRPISFEGDTRASRIGGSVAKAYGYTTELGREMVPWFNYTQQGMKRIGEAYLKDPAKFTGRMWLYTLMPAAGTYLYTRGLGNDPNGRSYSDYMMNGRSEYQKTMNFYIPIPGLPAEQGIEFPRYHEVSIGGRMMEEALNHLYKSNIFSQSEDFDAAARSFLNVAVLPPMPPLGNVPRTVAGMSPAETAFSSGGYMRRSEPFDQTGGFPASVEMTARALGGGIAEYIGLGYAGFSQSHDNALVTLKNVLKEIGKREIQKTPLLRNAAGLPQPATGNTRVVEELFAKQRAIGDLVKYIQKWGEAEEGMRGDINTDPKSYQGGLLATDKLGKPVPSQSAGIDQPPPTNPLYSLFADQVYQTAKKDVLFDKLAVNSVVHTIPGVNKGRVAMSEGYTGAPTQGIGIPSLWARYGDASEQLRRLKNINAANHATWQMQLEKRPEQMQYLKENKVDYKDPVAVRNFYENIRQNAARVILHTIKKVEADFSQRIGRPVTIEMLSPYGKQGDPNTGDPYAAPDMYSVNP